MDKRAIDAIVSSLKNRAGEWVFSSYRARHSESGTNIWIGNGIHALDINGYGGVARTLR